RWPLRRDRSTGLSGEIEALARRSLDSAPASRRQQALATGERAVFAELLLGCLNVVLGIEALDEVGIDIDPPLADVQGKGQVGGDAESAFGFGCQDHAASSLVRRCEVARMATYNSDLPHISRER